MRRALSLYALLTIYRLEISSSPGQHSVQLPRELLQGASCLDYSIYRLEISSSPGQHSVQLPRELLQGASCLDYIQGRPELLLFRKYLVSNAFGITINKYSDFYWKMFQVTGSQVRGRSTPPSSPSPSRGRSFSWGHLGKVSRLSIC